MNQKILVFLIFDTIISLGFIGSNLWIWSLLNNHLTRNSWGPLQIAIVPQTLVDGKPEIIGTFTAQPNLPFILFCVAIVGNLLLAILALRSKNSK